MVLNVHRNHKAYWGRGEGREEGVGMEVGQVFLIKSGLINPD